MHSLYDDYLTKAHHANALATKFLEVFNEGLDQYPLGEWTTTSVVAFMKHQMWQSAMVTLFGSKRLELAPETHRLYWNYEEYAWHFFYGVPRWMFPSQYKSKDELYAASARYLEAAWENFDWEGPDAESDWEAHFGSRFSREVARWMKQSGFEDRTIAGFFSLLLFALHSNTLPMTTWMLIYLIEDPDLFQAVREEALSAYASDPVTHKPQVDLAKLVTLPLLQSVFTETLRLHMSFNHIREAKAPIVFDGYTIQKGSWLQAFSGISHREEAWDKEGHPASEFWVGRHLTYREETDEKGNTKQVPQFSIAGKGGTFFPFGGGTGMCPGRHFAKQEALIALAAIVTRFDVEFLEWINKDGSRSNRRAMGDERFAGAGTMPPDRDMKIRWRRTW